MISSIFWEIFCEHFFLPRSFQKFLPFAFLPSGSFRMLKGREVQNCELKKFSVFRDLFCFSNGHAERLPPLPHQHSGFCSLPRWLFWLNFVEAVFRWHVLFSLQKKTHTHTKNSGEISVEKFGENIPFFGAFFGAFFGTFFGAFFGGQLFASKSEKFLQNPFCKRDPSNSCVRARMIFSWSPGPLG